MPDADRRARGMALEETAARYLAQHGATVLERNFQVRRGEVDIVGQEGEVLLFVEVRSRRSNAPVGPAESVTRQKALSIVRAAREYLARRGIEDRPVRFDVIAMTTDDAGAVRSIEWLKDFFDLSDL